MAALRFSLDRCVSPPVNEAVGVMRVPRPPPTVVAKSVAIKLAKRVAVGVANTPTVWTYVREIAAASVNLDLRFRVGMEIATGWLLREPLALSEDAERNGRKERQKKRQKEERRRERLVTPE